MSPRDHLTLLLLSPLSRSASRLERPASRAPTNVAGGDDHARRQQLRAALVKKLLSKYHPGIANSKTEAQINEEVDKLMTMPKVTEADLHAVEGRVRQQSNEEIAWITTNPFKRVTAYKSGARDEWAMVIAFCCHGHIYVHVCVCVCVCVRARACV